MAGEKYDIIFVDDDESLCDSIVSHARDLGLKAEGFYSCESAKLYLLSCPNEVLPESFILDMHFANEKTENAHRDLYKYIKSRGKEDYVLFFTGSMSPPDEESLDELSAPGVEKTDKMPDSDQLITCSYVRAFSKTRCSVREFIKSKGLEELARAKTL